MSDDRGETARYLVRGVGDINTVYCVMGLQVSTRVFINMRPNNDADAMTADVT